MRPLPVPVAREHFCPGQPVVRLAGELGYGTVRRGAVQQTEGTLVDLGRGSAVHVLAGRRGLRPDASEGACHALLECSIDF